MALLASFTSSVKAKELDPIKTLTQPPTVQIPPPEKPKPKPVTPPEPKKYVTIEGDTLTKIARDNSTTIERLFDKNTQLVNPDVLDIGVELIIPDSTEQLEPRLPVVAEKPSEPIKKSSGGANTYQPGQCTWYVKNLRPDIPNTWGNASIWLYSAQRDGWSTGSSPKVGAIGWTPGHVVIVTSVNADGTVNITDMNGNWTPWEIGNRTFPASKYVYIY